MKRRVFAILAAVSVGLGVALPVQTWAADESADAMIKRMSEEVLAAIKGDKAIRAGDTNRLLELVNSKIMPNVDFQRMTAATVGPAWRQATPEQKKKLQEEFKTLLVHTYSGALAQINDETVSMKPQRGAPEDKEVVVRTEIRGHGDPIQLDYRMESTPAGWKIYNLNVLGVWLVETYRTQFAQEINSKGVEGLIAALEERNRSNAGKKS
jgi:phospholipid transport system substrate-binding protein